MSWIIKTNKIMVRPVTLDDAEIFVKWWNNGELMKDVGFRNGLNTTLEKVKQGFVNNDKTKVFIIYDSISQLPIGELSYGELNNEEKSCRIGIKICEVNLHGKRYGHDALCEFINYLFTERELNIIYIDTFLTNVRALNLYKKLGSETLEIINNFWTNPEGISYDVIFLKLDKVKFYEYYRNINK